MAALGTFTVTIAADIIDGPKAESADITIVPSVRYLRDADADKFYLPQLPGVPNGRSLPAALDLPTDVTTGTSSAIGYTVTVRVPGAEPIVSSFAARPAGTTISLADVPDGLPVVDPTDLTDAALAARYSDPTSAFRQSVEAGLAAGLAAAIAAQALSDKGAGFVTKLDQRQPSAVIAVLSDSTGFRNASGFYVGTDGREWPKQVARWISDTYSRVAVNYRLLASDSPVTYAANQVIADGVTGGAVTYVLSDDFVRAAGPLPGTSGTVGSPWTSNSGATSFNLDGSGNAVQAADTGTTAGTSAPGRLKTTWVYELVPTVAGTVNLLGSYVDGSNILWMTDNSNDVVDCKVSTTAGGTVIVKSFTYAEAGVSATATADVTASIEHKTDGTVVFTFGAATYTHTLSAGDDAKFAATSRAGMSGSRVGYKMRSITATSPLPTTPPDTTVDVYNASFSSKDAQWSQANYAALVPVAPDVLVISHSHNHEAETPATFEATLDALVATAQAAHPNAAIVIASQNPKLSPAPNRDAHTARVRDLRRYARVKGFGYLPIYEAFMAESNPAGMLNSDGVHPLPPGIDLIGTTAKSYLKALSVRWRDGTSTAV